MILVSPILIARDIEWDELSMSEQGVCIEHVLKNVPPGHTPRFVVYNEAPVVINQARLVYPIDASREGIEGTVVLRFEVLIDGSVGAIEILQSVMPGPGGLDEAAVETMRQWEFSPAKMNGNPVAVWLVQPFTFRLTSNNQPPETPPSELRRWLQHWRRIISNKAQS